MKRFNFNYWLVAALGAALVGLSACKSEDELILNITYEAQEIPSEGKEVTFAIESNIDWAATSTVNWLDIKPQQGSGNAIVSVIVKPNSDEEGRQAIITVSGGNLTREISITQAAYVLLPPEAAGSIEGKEQGEPGETIVLTVAEIPYASTYKWYRNGTEIQNTASRTLSVDTDGTYAVAGENGLGEGQKSPVKTVTYSKAYVFDTAKATYEGGDYNNAYVVEFSRAVNADTEIGAIVTFYEEKPDYNNILLPVGSYESVQPYQHNYTAVGTIKPNSEYSMDGTCFYIKKKGQVKAETVNYAKEKGGSLEVAFVDGTYTITGSLDCFIASTEVDADGYQVTKTEDSGTFTFKYSGQLKFENNWRDWGVYYYDADFLDSDYDLGKVKAAYLKYGGTEGSGVPRWGLELWSSSQSEAGYDVFANFYSAKDTIPEGTYSIAEEPGKGVRGTAERGYYLKPAYYGMVCKHWNPELPTSDYDKAILGQPVKESYLKIEKIGDDEYKISYLLIDSRNHKISANYSGHVEILQEGSEGKTGI